MHTAPLRRLFTTHTALQNGFTESRLKHAVAVGAIQHVRRGVYAIGGDPPTPIEQALATSVALDGVVSGPLAGLLHKIDGVVLQPPFATVSLSRTPRTSEATRSDLDQRDVILLHGYACTSGLRTIVDLAASLDDLHWEQALESALRLRLCSLCELAEVKNRRGVARIRRVLKLRPSGAPPTESLLETLAVQLIRQDPNLPTPQRQVEVHNEYGKFVGRVDLAWPEFGVFLELDGQHHLDQPIYDASRQTAITVATGWRVGRFTWHEIIRTPSMVLRRLRSLLA